MLEIKVLIKKLRSYPENSFVYPVEHEAPNIHVDDREPANIQAMVKSGLVIADLQGNIQGFIPTGGKDEALDK